MAKIIRINARPAYEARIEAENRAYTRHAMQTLDSFISKLVPAHMPAVHVRLPQRVHVRTIVVPRHAILSYNLPKMHVHSSAFAEENRAIDAEIQAMLRSGKIRFAATTSHMPV